MGCGLASSGYRYLSHTVRKHVRTATRDRPKGRRAMPEPIHHTVDAPAAAVWAVLADGWLYANWVVGASRVRLVDNKWPAPSSRIHHSFGAWPVVIDDSTHVLDSVPEQRLELAARGWPLGEARVELTVTSQGDQALVTLTEDIESGPGRVFPVWFRQLVVRPRNNETLKRLALLTEGRHRAGLLK